MNVRPSPTPVLRSRRAAHYPAVNRWGFSAALAVKLSAALVLLSLMNPGKF